MDEDDPNTRYVDIRTPSPPNSHGVDLNETQTSNAPSVTELWSGASADLDAAPTVDTTHDATDPQPKHLANMSNSIVENYRSDVSSDGEIDVVDVHCAQQAPTTVTNQDVQSAGGQSSDDGNCDKPPTNQQDVADKPSSSGNSQYVLKQVKQELLNQSTFGVTVPLYTPPMPTINCSWFADGSGAPFDINAPNNNPALSRYLYHPHLETDLDKNTDVASNRVCEDGYMMHAPVVGQQYLVLTSGLFWDGVLRSIDTQPNGDVKYTFSFPKRVSSKATQSSKIRFNRRKVYPHMTAAKHATKGLARTSDDVKRTNRGDFIRKGDIVKLADGRVGTVYYNNTYTHRLMVYIQLQKYLVCYTQVCDYKRLLANRDWSAKEYVASEEALRDIEFPGADQAERGRRRKKSSVRTPKSTRRPTARSLTKTPPAHGRRQRKSASAAPNVVKDEPADETEASTGGPSTKNKPSTRVLTNRQGLEVRAAVAEAVKTVSAEVAQAVSAEVSRQVHEALYPVTLAALKVFTASHEPRAPQQAERMTPEAVQASQNAPDSYMRLSTFSPIPLCQDDDENESASASVRRSLATDFSFNRPSMSPLDQQQLAVMDKLNATHHADDDDLTVATEWGDKGLSPEPTFVAPLSPLDVSGRRKRPAKTSADTAVRAVEAALSNLAKVARSDSVNPPSPTKTTAKPPPLNKNTTKSPSPKKLTSKSPSPKKLTPKKQIQPTPKRVKKPTPKKPSWMVTKDATPTAPKKDACAPKLHESSQTPRRASPRKQAGSASKGKVTPRKRPSITSYDASSPLDETTTVSSMLSAEDVEEEIAAEQDANAAHELNHVTVSYGVKMSDVTVTYGKDNRTRFDSQKIKTAILANPRLLLGASKSGYVYVTAIKLEVGCAVWIAEANKGCMRADNHMKMAGEAAARGAKTTDFSETLNAYVTAFTDYLYRQLPQPVYFADTFKDPTTANPKSVDDVRLVFKEPFGTAFAEGLTFIQRGKKEVTALAFLAARAVMKKIVHRQTCMKSRGKA